MSATAGSLEVAQHYQHCSTVCEHWRWNVCRQIASGGEVDQLSNVLVLLLNNKSNI